MSSTLRISLIHTVKSVYESFEPKLRGSLKRDVRIDNILDTYLADDPDEIGYVSDICKKRLFEHLLAASQGDPRIIAVTCSAMSETVKELRPFFSIPLVTIDEGMIKAAVDAGRRITVLATAVSSSATTAESVRKQAEADGKEVEITVLDNQAAFDLLSAGDREAHDKMVIEQAAGIGETDVVVLAQASMAHLKKAVEEVTGCQVLTSPDSCIASIIRLLDEMEKEK